MSNEKLQKYRDLYSQYIDHAVNLHNYHLVFIKNVGLISGQDVRGSLRTMMRLEKELQKASLEAYKEHRQNLREERALKKLNAKKSKKAKGTKNGNNNSTSSTV